MRGEGRFRRENQNQGGIGDRERWGGAGGGNKAPSESM